MYPMHAHQLKHIDFRLLAIGIATLYWLADSVMRTQSPAADGLLGKLFLTDDPYHIILRAIVSGLILFSGFLIQRYRQEIKQNVTRHILDNMPQAFIAVDSDWHIRHINRYAEDLLSTADTDADATAPTLWDRYPEFCSFFYTSLNQAMKRLEQHPIKGFYPPSGIWLEINPVRNDNELSLYIHDITVEHDLADDNRRQRTIIDNLHDGIITIDRHSVIMDFNKAAENIFGYSRKEVLGKDLSILMPENIHKAHAGYIQNYILTGESKIMGNGSREIMAKRKNGTLFPLDIGISRQYIGDELLFIGIARDVTERHQLLKALEYSSNYDSLTGLPNRMLFNDRMVHAVTFAKRHKRLIAVMFLDLDNFKEINDSLGHTAGDILLKEVASRLKQCVRDSDTVARWGGDEFMLILENLAEPSQASRVAKTIIRTLEQPFRLQEEEVTTGCSIGICIYPNDGKDIELLQKAADKAMYQAKKKGRGTFHYYAAE